jgi:hypothetical protein
MMKNDIAFQKLCKQFHQDIGLIARSTDELVSIVTGSLSPLEKSQLKLTLEVLNSAIYSDDQLLAIWNASAAEV